MIIHQIAQMSWEESQQRVVLLAEQQQVTLQVAACGSVAHTIAISFSVINTYVIAEYSAVSFCCCQQAFNSILETWHTELWLILLYSSTFLPCCKHDSPQLLANSEVWKGNHSCSLVPLWLPLKKGSKLCRRQWVQILLIMGPLTSQFQC